MGKICAQTLTELIGTIRKDAVQAKESHVDARVADSPLRQPMIDDMSAALKTRTTALKAKCGLEDSGSQHQKIASAFSWTGQRKSSFFWKNPPSVSGWKSR
jgi:hypothetical protein